MVIKGGRPTFLPMISGSAINLTKVRTMYKMARYMPVLRLPVKDLIMAQGIIIMPLPKTGKKSIILMANAFKNHRFIPINFRPIAKIRKLSKERIINPFR